jgi:hypothetical protein
MAGAQLVVLALRFFRCIASDRLELRGTARLLSTVFARHLLVRGALLIVGAIVLPMAAPGPLSPNPAYMVVALGVAVSAEILGRYLFFVSVVPRHLAAPYLAGAREAA